MADQQIPVRTQVTLTLTGLPNSPTYTSTILGMGRYGLQMSLPQLLTASYSLPVQTKLTCTYIAPTGHDLLSFQTYVMGYERTEPPLMVIATPSLIESTNRRTSRRYPVAIQVGYVTDVQGVFGEQTQTVDLSMGGLCMRTFRPLPESIPLSMTLELTRDELILASGTVAWSGFRGRVSMAGVRFTAMKSGDAKALAQFLNQLERELAGSTGRR
ncbi:MAG TPA: PilZ domain-containing protein [Symbiobacteriaceae bacterium]|nr:PilZ domain-containing protein [Symbiobacteriaceae bacterium]